VLPVKVKGEAHSNPATGGGDDDDLEEIEEVDSLVSLKCPLSLERYEFPARGKNCAHLACFNLETFLMFSQQSGVWQCPVCSKPLPWEDLEVDLNMLSVIRETADSEPEITQIRVAKDGQYDVVTQEKGARDDDETGDGREPNSRKRKQPSASPTATSASNIAQPPPAQRQALGNATEDGPASWLPQPGAGAAPGASPSVNVAPGGPAGSPTAAGVPPPAVSPTAAAAAAAAADAAGTADEPIELD